ncbi:MAG: cell division protein FtsL [Fidelibacterota bacterium]|nr:MAG: cell division protein FtsL [Candidatus Neomarinimicrobiota bacterium]
MGGVRRQVRTPGHRQKGRTGGPSLISFFFWTFFLVSTAIAYLWIYNQTDTVATILVEKRKLIFELENTNRELQVSIDQLSKIDRITRIARSQLGMVVPPAESLIVYLSEISE